MIVYESTLIPRKCPCPKKFMITSLVHKSNLLTYVLCTLFSSRNQKFKFSVLHVFFHFVLVDFKSENFACVEYTEFRTVVTVIEIRILFNKRRCDTNVDANESRSSESERENSSDDGASANGE